MEMLEQNIKKIGLSTEEKDLLREGCKTGNFNKAAKEVAEMLKARGKRDVATIV